MHTKYQRIPESFFKRVFIHKANLVYLIIRPWTAMDDLVLPNWAKILYEMIDARGGETLRGYLVYDLYRRMYPDFKTAPDKVLHQYQKFLTKTGLVELIEPQQYEEWTFCEDLSDDYILQLNLLKENFGAKKTGRFMYPGGARSHPVEMLQ